ncbi:MAG: hypothetical protein KBD01_04910 [Acidobacteria bacterium]|nr:hypothetical protein [Acidobacteriota bacterium]
MQKTVSANDKKLGPAEALTLVRSAKRLVVGRGTKVVSVPVTRTAPSDEEILALVLGPTGNLRAPTLKKGDTLLVGFSEEAYAREL